MAVSNVILCGICDAQHISNVAIYWCPECDEGLCSPCQNYHNVSKASRQHGIISIDDYQKLPAEICKIDQNCAEHDRKFQMFCSRHDQLCCLICIAETHKECNGIYPIEEAIKLTKSSTLFYSLEKSLKDIKEKIERVVKDREANLVEIKQQHLKSLTDIKETRQKINSRLDELENHTTENLNSAETKVKLKIKTLLDKLAEKMKTIKVLMTNLMVVKQHGSDLQAFISSKMLEKDVTKELNYILNISGEDGFSQLDLKCQIDVVVLKMLSNVNAFGSVTILENPSSIISSIDQEKQAFTIVPPCTRSIDDITASLVGKFNVSAGKSHACITGSSVFPDGRMVFADCYHNKRLVIIQSDGTLDTEIPFSPLQPFDVTCIDDKTVAIAIFFDNQIIIVDTKTKQVTKTINTGKCCGITYRHGQLFYCEFLKGIVAIELPNNKVFTFVKDNSLKSYWSYITTSGENIYYTDNGSTVKCYSVTGEKRWEYKNESILSGPTGIAVDEDGSIYAISNKNTSVVLISSDGKHGRKLLTVKDEIELYGIFLHSNKLTIVDYDGHVFKYDIA